MTKPKPNDAQESGLLAHVRQWRRQAFEARQHADQREQSQQTQDLLRRLGLKPRGKPDDRRTSAA
jgi:hypothetical protein